MISVSWFLMCASSCDHARGFVARQRVEQAGVHRDGSVLRVTAGRERIRLRVVDDVDARHRQAGTAGEPMHQRIEVGRGTRVNLLGAVHRQHHLVGIPVGEQVHARRDYQRDRRAARSADQVTNAHEQRGQACEQDGRAEIVHSLLQSRGLGTARHEFLPA